LKFNSVNVKSGQSLKNQFETNLNNKSKISDCYEMVMLTPETTPESNRLKPILHELSNVSFDDEKASSKIST